jgi:hypothetical protein
MRRLYNEVYRITPAVKFSNSVQFSLGDSHGKFVVEVE